MIPGRLRMPWSGRWGKVQGLILSEAIISQVEFIKCPSFNPKMGLHFKDLVVKKEISLQDLRGKVLAVDAYNNLYQYLTTIRSANGTVLTDRKGHVTSHLIGLFNRSTSLMEQGAKLVFVFDGKPPAIKQRTWEKRAEIKKEASLRLKEAEEAGDTMEMRKFSSRAVSLNREMIEDAQHVIRALGLPIVQAPSEGEAQTASMAQQGKAYASVSQDYDNLIFGCPRLIRNLSIEGKKKKVGTLGYEIVKPEMIVLKDVLDHLNVSQDQLIILAILIGTDYNPGGIKGIGPKTALKLVKEYGQNFSALFQQAEWAKHYPDLTWEEVFSTIKKMPVTDEYTLEWKPLEEQNMLKLLVGEHDFNEERVKSKLEKLRQVQRQLNQKSLGGFLYHERQ